MKTPKKRKKNLIVSYKNLSDDLKELFKEAYPEGYNNYLQKFVKPNGEAIFVVPFETDDTAYMVKFEVKIDTLGEDLDKALFDDDSDDGKEEEFAPLSEALDKEEENTSHRERYLRHGDFEDLLDDDKKKKASLGVDKEGLKEALGDAEEAEELDSYDTLDDEDEDTDEDFEPTDEDLRGIEEEYLDAEIPPLDATIPDEEIAPSLKKGKSRKAEKKAAPKATPKAAPKTTPKAAPKAAPKVAPKVAPKKAAPKVAPQKATPKVVSKAAPKATPKATPKAAPKAAPKKSTPAKKTKK